MPRTCGRERIVCTSWDAFILLKYGFLERRPVYIAFTARLSLLPVYTGCNWGRCGIMVPKLSPHHECCNDGV